MQNHSKLVGYFFLYSFLGWIIDTADRSWVAGHYSVGSVLPVPLCPIYGFGVVASLLLAPLLRKLPLLFEGLIYGVALAVMEFLTGEFFLRMFHRRLWNYPTGFMNLDGFTDVFPVLLWGTAALLVVYFIHPFINALLRKMRLSFLDKYFIGQHVS